MLLKEIADVQAGQGAPQGDENYCKRGVPFVKAGNLLELIEGKNINDIQSVSEEVAKKYKLKLQKAGSILFAKSGMSCMKGYVYILPRDAYVVSHLAIITPKNLRHSKYLGYYFEYYKPNRLVKDTSYPSISLMDIQNISIIIKEDKLEEIIKTLDKIKKIIKNYKTTLIHFDELVKARFVEMFGDMKPTVKLNKYIIELRAGKSLAGNEICKNKVLKTGAATFGFFDKDQYKYYPKEYKPNPLHKVETGDVIISRMNTPELVGACSYVYEAPDNTYYPDRLWKVIVNENTNPIFLWQLMWQQEIRKQIKENSYGTSGTMNNISKIKLLNINAIDVPISLQNQFADFVKEVDKSRFIIKSMIKEGLL